MLKNVWRLCAVVGVLNAFQPYHITQPPKWVVNVLKDTVSAMPLKDIESGFDLNADEIQKLKLWRDGIVQYYIDLISFDKVLRYRIRNFLEVTSGITGLQFNELPHPPLDPKTRYVFFINRRGLLECADHNLKNFTNEGVQKIILGYDCITNHGGLAEVVLLVAGIPPQHNSPDRDQYIKVNMDKIIPEKRYLYDKVSDREWLFHDLEYDFSSSGHYHFHENTIDGSATISPLKPVDELVGEGDGFSFTDILKIRMLYNYIGKKPYHHPKDKECKKLFKPGSNLANYYINNDNEVQPRKKPNQYLGLSADVVKNDNEDTNEADNENDDNYKNANGNDKGKEDNRNEAYKENGNDEDDKRTLKKSNIRDPLSFLSDYETDDGKKKKREVRNENVQIKIRS